ncbi:MAG: TrbC/VirB2 family protein [Ectobacillus sp.]
MHMLKRMYAILLATVVLVIPHPVFAVSDDPTTIVKNVTNGIINFFMIVSPSIGTAAIMALGIMYKLTNSSSKKSEYKNHMKETLIVVAIVLSAGVIMKWFIGLLG